MKFNKRQFFILALTIVICFAVFINWKLTKTNLSAELSNLTSTTEKTLGEAKFVNANESGLTSNSVTQNEYFIQARLNKRKAREESIALLKTISDGASNDADSKKKALDDIRKIALATEKEDRIESLVKSKGFNDCVTLIGDKNVNIVVQTTGLKANEAAQIKDIAVNEASVSAEKVIIIEIK